MAFVVYLWKSRDFYTSERIQLCELCEYTLVIYWYIVIWWNVSAQSMAASTRSTSYWSSITRREAALDIQPWTNGPISWIHSTRPLSVNWLEWPLETPTNSPFTRHPDGPKGCQRHKLLSGPKSPDHWMTWSVRLNRLVCVMQLLILKPRQLYKFQPPQKRPKKICCSDPSSLFCRLYWSHLGRCNFNHMSWHLVLANIWKVYLLPFF